MRKQTANRIRKASYFYWHALESESKPKKKKRSWWRRFVDWIKRRKPPVELTRLKKKFGTHERFYNKAKKLWISTPWNRRDLTGIISNLYFKD